MLNKFSVGNIKTFSVLVEPKDTATFNNGNVHPVYATFALGRDVEWCCRLFVLEMLENDEEGIGTFLSIEHKSPALLGQTISIEAIVESLIGNEIICTYTAKVNDRVVAVGKQGQKILKKEKLERLFASLK